MKGNTWSEEACGERIRMEMGEEWGLVACKAECNKDESCTAIEHSTDVFGIGVKCCILRKCPVPVPEPQVEDAIWHPPAKYVGYVKRKYTPAEVSISGI